MTAVVMVLLLVVMVLLMEVVVFLVVVMFLYGVKVCGGVGDRGWLVKMLLFGVVVGVGNGVVIVEGSAMVLLEVVFSLLLLSVLV